MKVDIIHMVKVKKLSHREAAEIQNVKKQLVDRLIQKVNRNPAFLKQMIDMEATKERNKENVLQSLDLMISSNQRIYSIAVVQDRVKQDHNLCQSQYLISKIMKDYAGLSFCKVKKLANQANSLRNLYMRQCYGIKMLDLLSKGTRIINIDETWIGQTTYTRQLWQNGQCSGSLQKNPVAPRISMIVALDNYGDLYLSVSQGNTNQYSFCEFVRQLVKKLDIDRPRWRRDTIFLIDGATYHTTDLVTQLYQKLKIRVLVSAPYSFDGAVAELWFAAFKNGEINIRERATSKKFFQNIVDIAVAKAQTIGRPNLIMLWHHVVYKLFGYLDLRRL